VASKIQKNALMPPIAKTAMGRAMDEEDVVVVEQPAPKCEQAQMCDSMIALSRAVDLARDTEARDMLLKTMAAVLYSLNPPKGELRELRKTK